MYPILEHIHSGLRYLLLLLLVSLLIHALSQLSKRHLRKPAIVHAKITAHTFYLNVLIGVWLYLISPKVLIGPEAFKETMFRFFSLEHPVMIFIALAVFRLGDKFYVHRKGKKAYARLAALVGLTLLILFLAIPWPFRPELVTTWF